MKKRITIITGHFGSGKTNISVNLALKLKKSTEKVTLVDLDIVNPYFRAADSTKMLESAGIKCIVPLFANTNVDMPALPADIFSVFDSGDISAIFDVGGDDVGAAALGGYKKHFDDCGYEMYYVCNMYRPLTETALEAVELMREIEYVSRLKCTGIINNSNLGAETTPDIVKASFDYADEICRLSGLPLIFTSSVTATIINYTKNYYGG